MSVPNGTVLPARSPARPRMVTSCRRPGPRRLARARLGRSRTPSPSTARRSAPAREVCCVTQVLNRDLGHAAHELYRAPVAFPTAICGRRYGSPMAEYPDWVYYPTHTEPPAWVSDLVGVIRLCQGSIESRAVDSLTSDQVL